MTVATNVTVAAAVLLFFAAHVRTQSGVTDAELEAASGGRVVRVGPAAGSDSDAGGVVTWPLEVYVARVLAGEAEPEAADAALEALAVAIRTYALANAGRHADDGFDLCDGHALPGATGGDGGDASRGDGHDRPDPHVERCAR